MPARRAPSHSASRAEAAYPFSPALTAAVNICFAHARLVTPEVTATVELLALQTVLATMWAAWGVVPMVLAGESFSEYATLDRAGVLEFPDVLVLVSVRVVLMLLRRAKRHGHTAVVPPRRAHAARAAAHHVRQARVCQCHRARHAREVPC